jgi:diaminopropionate ammonia-lyase
VPAAGRTVVNLFGDQDFAEQRAFFAARPDLAPTPLRAVPGLARRLGIGALLVKDETHRFGLNAFKAAGATFAIATLRARGEIQPGATLVCASEGNHGRAVAQAAREAGCTARVYLADSVAPARVQAIQSTGAAVIAVRGTYDDAVREMARDAAVNDWLIVSDTSWPGYEEIPRLIMLGYTRLLDEAEAAWSPALPPDVIFVQAGVGGLLAAVACWADWRFGPRRPRIVAVEPVSAACLQISARHGIPTTLDGPFETIMGGLRCGEVSRLAFAATHSLVDAYVAIEDDWAREATRALARPTDGDPAIEAGASGAAALGGLLAALRDPAGADVRAGIPLTPGTRALVVVTEGVTDPAAFRAVLSRPSTTPMAR